MVVFWKEVQFETLVVQGAERSEADVAALDGKTVVSELGQGLKGDCILLEGVKLLPQTRSHQ